MTAPAIAMRLRMCHLQALIVVRSAVSRECRSARNGQAGRPDRGDRQ